MSRVSSVSNESDVAVMPALVSDAHEVRPRRFCAVRRVRLEPVSIEPFAEHRLARRNRLRDIHPVEAGSAPGFFVAFHDERRRAVVEPITVRLKDAMLVFDEVESECVEREGRAKPDVARRAVVEIRLELLGVLLPDRAVDSVRGNDQVCPGQLAVIIDFSAESELSASLGRAMLKDLEELFARDSAETVTA